MFSIAPMMDWTDRHCRYLMRLMTRRALLYTEMITAQSLAYGNKARLLDFHPFEKPLAIQLGGSDPKKLAQASALANQWGYDEVNLNVGCPSPRVQEGRFGACLMKEAHLVATCVEHMRSACSLPITIKCRIGVDDQPIAQTLPDFIQCMQDSGVQTFIIHARKAWLKGLSPKDNRTIPPLDYDCVYAMKARFPQATIILNGGISTPMEGIKHLSPLDGVMLGRSVYKNLYLLTQVDHSYFHMPKKDPPSRFSIAKAFLDYIETQEREPLWSMSRHLLGLVEGIPGAKAWRHAVSQSRHLAALKSVVYRLADQKLDE